jgi:hypothetical protein
MRKWCEMFKAEGIFYFWYFNVPTFVLNKPSDVKVSIIFKRLFLSPNCLKLWVSSHQSYIILLQRILSNLNQIEKIPSSLILAKLLGPNNLAVSPGK